MAVGDVVNGISANNTILTFQPAAGVECCITSVGTDNINTNGCKLYNGTLLSGQARVTEITNQSNIKIFINNTNYLYLPALGVAYMSHYTGIQTK